MSIGIGDALRSAREEQGRSIEEAARGMDVPDEKLLALEEEEFRVFGADVYAKGFLTNYARYLGLDPEPLVEQYRSHVQHDDDTPQRLASGPVATTGRGTLPSWIGWVLVAVVLLGGAIALGNLLGGRAPTPAVEDQTAAPPQPADTGSPTRGPSPSLSPSTSPTVEGVDLLLALEEDSWMRVTVDGTVVLEEVVPRGDTRSFEGEETVTIRFGNAGGVRVELNGQDLGFQGDRGQVRTVTFTPEGPQEA